MHKVAAMIFSGMTLGGIYATNNHYGMKGLEYALYKTASTSNSVRSGSSYVSGGGYSYGK